MDKTVLLVVREGLVPDWKEGRALLDLLERFTGTTRWDDPVVLMAAYEQHNVEVRQTIPPERLLEWHPEDGWEPLCLALKMPVPDMPFPWLNKREAWG